MYVVFAVVKCLLDAFKSNSDSFDRECHFQLASRRAMWGQAVKVRRTCASFSSGWWNVYLVRSKVCVSFISIYSLSDLGGSSNLIGSISRTNWTLFTLLGVNNAWSKKNKMAGVTWSKWTLYGFLVHIFEVEFCRDHFVCVYTKLIVLFKSRWIVAEYTPRFFKELLIALLGVRSLFCQSTTPLALNE